MENITVTRQDIIKAYAVHNLERFSLDAAEEIIDVITRTDDITSYIFDLKCMDSNNKAMDCISRLLRNGYALSVLPPDVFTKVERLHAERVKFALIITDMVTGNVLGAIDGDHVIY